jgi:hypothetical protein
MMQVDEAMTLAEIWIKGVTVYEGAQGWRVACHTLATEVRRLRNALERVQNFPAHPAGAASELTDVLERARWHLRQMAPHVRARESAQIMAELVQELQWERGRPPGKITLHWIRTAFDRVAAGEPEDEVMRDFGYERSTASLTGGR